ncbi:GH32 C-terminal domain-containing protein [Mucilaginibacter hurinus]
MADYLKEGKGLDGTVFENFEKGLVNWKTEGAAFAVNAPGVVDHLGHSYAGSSSKTRSTGKLVSKPFKITHRAINFLLAGGKGVDSTCIRLVVDGKILRTTTADNSNVLKWNGWDVRELIGRNAHIELVDKHPGTDNAFIAVDHILFSNKLMNQQLEHAQWLDYGPDYYATRTWRNYDDNKNIADSVFAISWMGNWDYANKVPTKWGKGFQSLPRVMALKQNQKGYTVVQNPVPQLQHLRGKLYQAENLKINGFQRIGFTPSKNSYEIDVVIKPTERAAFGFDLLEGEGRKLVLRYDPVTSIITLDRTNCTDHVSDADFTRLFAKKITTPVSLQNGTLRLHMFIDQSSIEVFVNDGETVISATTFPSERQLGISAFSEGGTTQVEVLKGWELNTIWK